MPQTISFCFPDEKRFFTHNLYKVSNLILHTKHKSKAISIFYQHIQEPAMHLPSKRLNSWFNSTKKTKPQSVELSIETLFWIPINRYLCSETVKCFCLEYCEYQLLRPQPMLHQSKQWSFNAWFVTSQTSTNFKVRYFLSTNQTFLLQTFKHFRCSF